MARHDILHGSQAWERISNGIPQEVTDLALRRILHDYAQIMTAVVDSLNRSLDAVEEAKKQADKEFERVHLRIDRRAEAHDALRESLFNPKEGYLIEQERSQRAYTDTKTGRMTGVLMVVLGGVVTASIMLAVQMGVGR